MRFVLFLLLPILAGCNRTAETPTAPTPPPAAPPAPTIAFFLIDATSIGRGTQAALTVGQTHQLLARASVVGGGQVNIMPVWQVDNRAVLTIDSQGGITGVANGWATVIATHSGVTATLVVRVATDYGGTWNGTWTLVRCDALDAAFCAQRFPPGSRRPLQLSIIMDRNFAIVRLSWDLDGATVLLQRALEVGEDGGLSFGGPFGDGRFNVPLIAASWRAQLTAADRITGRMVLIHGSTDAARTEWELTDARRSRE